MYNSGIKYFKYFLRALIQCVDDKVYKITFRKSIKGYGLTHSNFEQFNDCTSRNFAHWKQILLDLKLIWIPKVKNKQSDDGSNKSSYRRQYTISPLGICSFSSTTDKIGANDAKRIISILKFHSNLTLKWDWKEICKIIETEKASQILKQSCDSIKIIEVNGDVHLIFGYKSKEKTSYEFFKYIISKNQAYYVLPEGYFSDEPDVINDPIPLRIIDDNSFFTDIAEFILQTFCYSIIENCHWNIQKKTHILNFPLSTKKEKLDSKKIIEKYNTVLEKIPFETHLIASNFYREKIFGSIRREEKLSSQIFDYFNVKVGSRIGYEFKIEE